MTQTKSKLPIDVQQYCELLLEKFEPIVRRPCPLYHPDSYDVVPEVSVEFVSFEDRPSTIAPKSGARLSAFQMFMFHVCVTLPKPCTAADLITLAEALDKFCGYDDYPGGRYYKVGKYRWCIGDGDDSQAVFFEDGRFKIWLRAWPLGQ